MSSTTTKPERTAASAPAVNGARVSVARLPLSTRQRRPGYIALLVVLVVGLSALGGWLYVSAGSKVAVLVVAADVPAGQVIQRSDLTTASLAGDVHAIAASAVDTVVGSRAAVELLPGTLLQRSMVSTGPLVPSGMAQVGVALKPGTIPADGVSPGDKVRLFRLPTSGGAAQASPVPVELASGTVFAAMADPSQAGGWLVTVTVPSDVASAVAAASGSGSAALVLVGSS